MLIFAGATTLHQARATAIAMAVEVELLPPIDLSHVYGGHGHSDAFYAMEQQEQVFWASGYLAPNIEGYRTW